MAISVGGSSNIEILENFALVALLCEGCAAIGSLVYAASSMAQKKDKNKKHD